MKTEAVIIDELFAGRVVCELRSPKGRYIAIDMRPDQAEPEISGDSVLTDNQTIRSSLLLGIGAYLDSRDDTLDEDDRKSRAKTAENLFRECSDLAALSDHLTDQSRQAWCSSCLYFCVHRKVDRRRPGPAVYLCGGCGSATTTCAVRGCDALALHKRSLLDAFPYCAEHRHEIPSFENAGAPLPDLDAYRDVMQYRRSNMAKHTHYATVGVAAAGVASVAAAAAAPAIGGIIGVKLLGLSGAAATNAGLAALGGGSLAAGGFGMAGGTTLITMAGTVLGGVWGTRYLSGYLDSDTSFNIEKLREGTGPAVVIARGFTTENYTNWRTEVRFAELLYDNPTIYLLSWGAKELRDLGLYLGFGAARNAAVPVLKKVAKKASRRAAEKLGPLGIAVSVLDIGKNPWHVAVNKSERAGQALAELIAKTDRDDWVLIGHSLGGRLMLKTAIALSQQNESPRILDVHLLGAAVSQRPTREWQALANATTGSIHNYHSKQDRVLAGLYRLAQANRIAVGHSGFQASFPSIIDQDVSDLVTGHSDYYSVIVRQIKQDLAETE